MKAYLISLQVLYILSFIPWYVIWLLSFMVFDGGVNAWNASFVLSITLYPVFVIVCAFIAWMYRKRSRRVAIVANALPLVVVSGVFTWWWAVS